MTASVGGSAHQLDFAALFRQRWEGRIVNDGDVRSIGGFDIDVTGTAAYGKETFRSKITPGSGGKTYEPGEVSPTPDISLPASNLVTFPGALQTVLRAAQDDASPQAISGENPYEVSLPAWVDIDHSEAGRPEQLTTVRYAARTGEAQEALNIENIDRLRALADIETQLGAEFGQPVKLAWDGGSGEYLMLRPGQEGYDRVLGANDLVDRLPKTLKALGYTAGMVQNILA